MIDFICPTKIDDQDRLALFKQSIASLIKNTDPKYINRIIIVDDQSELDISKEEELSNPVITTFRGGKQLGVGGAKNKGVELHTEAGRGRYLYIFDNDVYFGEKWLENMLAAYVLHKDKFKLIGGGIHPFLQPRAGEGNSLLSSHDAISGWSWLMSYEVWDEYGTLADNALGVGKSEDWEYCQRIRNDGFLVGCLHDQVIAHCGMTNSEGEKIPGYNESMILTNKVAPGVLIK